MNRTIGELCRKSVAAYGPVPALRDHRYTPHVNLTYAEVGEQVRRVGSGLLALGLTKGDRVALFADSRPRWLICDMAILSTGLVSVPRGSDSADAELAYILEHSGARAVILHNARLANRVRNCLAAAKRLEHILIMEDSPDHPEPIVGKTLGTITQFIDSVSANASAFDSAVDAVKPADLGVIVYTSGTTGHPKGVMLSHSNLTHQSDTVDFGRPCEAGDVHIAILPAWHAYERTAEYLGFRHGHTFVYTDKRHLREDLGRERPHILPCVPRIWESVYDGIRDKLRREPAFRQRLVAAFLAIGHQYVRARRVAFGFDMRRAHHAWWWRLEAMLRTAALWPLYRLGDRLVFSKMRAVTGGRLAAAVSGGGSLAAYLDDFFEVLGITILNGYGLTETAPVLSIRRCNHNVRGSVGLPVAYTEIRIRSETGEDVPQGVNGVIWARGPQVMMGYYQNPEATATVIDDDGFLNTGDLGWIAATGDLVITGRAKDTIVLSSGENVEPDPIELLAKQSELVDQIMVVGQDQKVLGALVVPRFVPLARRLGYPEDTAPVALVADANAARIVREDLQRLMSRSGQFKASEIIARVALIESPFTEENGLLTQTLKLRRRPISEHYAAEITKLFE